MKILIEIREDGELCISSSPFKGNEDKILPRIRGKTSDSYTNEWCGKAVIQLLDCHLSDKRFELLWPKLVDSYRTLRKERNDWVKLLQKLI